MTTLAAPGAGRLVAAVAVALTGTGADGLAVGLTGGRQDGAGVVTTDADGASVLVLPVRADGDGPVTVTVAADPSGVPRDVVGVVAAAGTPETLKALGEQGPSAAAGWLAAAVAGPGVERLVDPPTVPGPGASTLSWKAP
nr:hypothetical protein [Angustibacter aerolatus]